MKKYRAAIIGLGKIAWQFDRGFGFSGGQYPKTHALAYFQNSQTQIVGGYDPDEESREAFAQEYHVPVYSDLEQMLGEAQAEIVSVCSPSERHYSQMKLLLQNTHATMIWLEKPPTLTVCELQDLLQQQMETSKTVLVNFMRRYSPLYRKVKEIVSLKTYGEVRGATVRYSRGLLNNGTHMIDILNFILDNSNRIELSYVDPEKCGGIARCEDFQIQFIHYEVPYHCLDIDITFDNARVSVLHGGLTLKVENRVENVNYPGFYHLDEDSKDGLSLGDNISFFDEALKDLIHSHEVGTDPTSSLGSAVNAMRIFERISSGI